MVDASGIAAEKGRRFQVDEKPVHGAHRQASEPCNIGSRQTSFFQCKETEQPKATLKRCNGVGPTARNRHIAPRAFPETGIQELKTNITQRKSVYDGSLTESRTMTSLVH